MTSSSNNYPVSIFELDESDKAFHLTDKKGRSPRVMLQQVDGDEFYFTNRGGAEAFMAVHGLVPVSDGEMRRLREMTAE